MLAGFRSLGLNGHWGSGRWVLVTRAFNSQGLISRGLVVGEFCMRGFGIQGLLDSTSVRTA